MFFITFSLENNFSIKKQYGGKLWVSTYSFILYVFFENQQITSTIANDVQREQLRREDVKEHAST